MSEHKTSGVPTPCAQCGGPLGSTFYYAMDRYLCQKCAFTPVERVFAPSLTPEQEEAVKNAYLCLVSDAQLGNAESLKAAFPSIQWDTP